MILYFIEFATLHILFYLVYRAFLRKETQLGFLRFFIVGSTMLSLILPLIKIPTATPILVADFTSRIYSLPDFEANPMARPALAWYEVIFISICFLMVIRLVYGLIKIINYRDNCSLRKIEGAYIYELLDQKTSFTFLRWIFIDTSHFNNPSDIIQHELGHAKKLHTLDVLLFQLVSIAFWWLPTVWLMLKELKNLHEFEADEYALKINKETYAKTLVQCTLRAHGMNLASSFDDAHIFNRLNFMKKMKKKISIWKLASIAAIVAISGAMVACEEELEAGIEEIIEESSQQVEYDDNVQAALDKLQRLNPGEKYAVIETKFENKESINRLNEYDPNQIEQIFVNKEGDEKSVVMIVNQSSDLFDKTIEIQEVNKSEVFTIVETPASFVGGVEGLYKYIGENMEYPRQAQNLNVEGVVVVQFIVETNGEISEVEVLKGIGAGCDAEAKRVIEESPKWNAGTQRGKAVRQKMIQKITFKLPS